VSRRRRRVPHGIDLGPLEPRLPGRLGQPTSARISRNGQAMTVKKRLAAARESGI
jgi:hypothetical protein